MRPSQNDDSEALVEELDKDLLELLQGLAEATACRFEGMDQEAKNRPNMPFQENSSSIPL